MSNWLVKTFDRMVESSWQRARNRRENEGMIKGLSNMVGAQAMVKESQEIDMNTSGRVNFDLTPAVGGHILTVTRRRNSHLKTSGLSIDSDSSWEKTTYVLAKEEDLGQRIAKIINLELFK